MTNNFTDNLLKWYQVHGRKNLPWQQNMSPYPIWVSEIMLQQTQVATVIPYYQKFMAQFKTLEDLANAPIDDVLHLWTGLGYYARARNLHKTAKIIMQQHNGSFPKDIEDIIALPGIGRSTAGAILSFSRNEYHPILDGNVKRVLTRYLAIEGWPGKKPIENILWQAAQQLTPLTAAPQYNQAIMDLGSSLCSRSRPNCEQCPVKSSCLSNLQGTQSQYPNSKPKKDKPIKQAYMLVHCDKVDKSLRVFLQQRPPTGIWGGLWCFPQYETYQALTDDVTNDGAEKLQALEIRFLITI